MQSASLDFYNYLKNSYVKHRDRDIPNSSITHLKTVNSCILNVLNSIKSLWENGFWYGDLKPANILYDDIEKLFYLGDLGSISYYKFREIPIQNFKLLNGMLVKRKKENGVLKIYIDDENTEKLFILKENWNEQIKSSLIDKGEDVYQFSIEDSSNEKLEIKSIECIFTFPITKGIVFIDKFVEMHNNMFHQIVIFVINLFTSNYFEFDHLEFDPLNTDLFGEKIRKIEDFTKILFKKIQTGISDLTRMKLEKFLSLFNNFIVYLEFEKEKIKENINSRMYEGNIFCEYFFKIQYDEKNKIIKIDDNSGNMYDVTNNLDEETENKFNIFKIILREIFEVLSS
jgi:serine/threonine protein kinase